MPTSASSAIWLTSCSVAMFHPADVVYVILQGGFITVFSGKLLQLLPDPAPVLHGFLLVPGKFCGYMAFCNLPERDFPLAALHLLQGRDRTCSAHHPHIHIAVSYTHLRAHETDSYLVCRLLLEKKKKETITTS